MIEYHVSDGLAVIRLGGPPLDAITFSLLEELQAATRRASKDGHVRGIVVTGDRARFSAGADLGIFQQIACRDDARCASRAFQKAFQEIEDCPKPVVAAVAGDVLGGALELALACHFRVAAKGSRFGSPEVKLGFNPGAGGTQRLPRLIGPGPALTMMLKADSIGVREAHARGLVDAVCEGDRLLETAVHLLRSAPVPHKTSRRSDKVHDPEANAIAFRNANKLAAEVHPEIIAPRRIIEAVRVGLEDSLEAGLRKENEAFAECLDTPAAQNKIYLFFATRQTSKLPELDGVTLAEITQAAVVGMGSMGSGITQALITAGVPVVVLDQDPSALEKGTDRIRKSLEKRVAGGRLSRQEAERMLGLVSMTAAWNDLSKADLAVEAVVEDVDVKRSVIAELEAACSARTIIASNTSTISLDTLAGSMQKPERLIGMHFFNPAHRMPLVEIIRRAATPPWVLAAALGLAKKLRKTPVVVNDREGFLVNRLFIPYLKEAFRLLEEGADPPAVDRAMVDFGFPMGPLALTDMAGLDVLVLTDRVLSRAFPRHGPPSQIALRLVDRGHLGQKTGSGVFRYLQQESTRQQDPKTGTRPGKATHAVEKYEKGDYTPHKSEAAEGIIAEVRREVGSVPRQMAGDEITQRLVLRMVNEAFYVMEEGIVARESDLDVAMVLGTGFPDFRGGVLRYARHLGLNRVLTELESLAETLGERFAPSRLLRDLSRPSKEVH